MKKFLFSVALLAALASCAKNEVIDIPQTDVIGFSSINDNVTKVANDDEDGVSYKVYAVHSSDAAADWYINDVVSVDEVAADGPYYWPSSDATLTFYAYAPSTAVVTNYVDTYPTAGFTYAVPAEAQEDFTMASIKTGQKTGTAQFTFAHKLAKVNVEVELDSDFDTAHDLVEGYTAAVSVFANSATVDVIGGTCETVTPTATDPALIKYDQEVLTYYIMPQDVDGCTIEIDGITVNNASSELPVFDGVDLTAITLDSTSGTGNVTFDSFEAGKEYTFTITVTASAKPETGAELEMIEFKATNGSWTSAADQTLAQPEA